MRFVPIKSEQQQSELMLHRSRQLLVRQRTMLSNAIRGHLAELGIISAKGRNGTAELLEVLAARDDRIPVDTRISRRRSGLSRSRSMHGIDHAKKADGSRKFLAWARSSPLH
jgi:transposase